MIEKSDTKYFCDRCQSLGRKTPTSEEEGMEVIQFWKAGMSDPKLLILCELHSRELEVILRKWWKSK